MRYVGYTEPPDGAVLAAAALEEAALEDPALTRHFAEVVARAPKMTAEQAAYLRRLFRYLPAGVTQ